MRVSFVRRGLVLVALTLFAFVAATNAFSAGVTPKTVTVNLNPGGSTTVAKDVETTKLPPNSDFVFLADNTGSMGPSIDDVKANAQSIIDAIEASGATNARYGVANYQDTAGAGSACPYLFQLNTDLTNATSAKAAINSWSAGDGCDIPESALFALHRVAVHDISWRSDTSGARFVIWFGDAPSHDPICDLLAGYSDPHPAVTEASATADLVGQGIHVIAASALSGPGLDADPKLYSSDYPPPCAASEQGAAGQALRITAATGGVDTVNPPASSISQTIIDAINALPPIPVVVTPVANCDAGLTVTNSPPTQTVPSGSTAHFSETITVSPSVLPGTTLHCTVDFTINGAPAGPDFQQNVTVNVTFPPSTVGCKVTGGGRITAANGDKGTFGGVGMGNGPSGQEEYQDHGPAMDMNVHSISVLSVVCSTDKTTATIFGMATVDGSASYVFAIDVKDLGEPGAGVDHYRIRLSNGYDSGDQVLDGGNIQIH
jgi:hypothetical protein